MVTVFLVPLFLPILFVVAGALSASRTGRPAVRVLARILWTTSILLTLACVAFAVWFYTSFELTW